MFASHPIAFFISRGHDTEAHTPHERDCYFEGEKELDYYKIYSKNNCLIQYSVKYFVNKCKCKPYWLPGMK